MAIKTKGTQTKTVNKQVMQVRYVNGIKTYYKAGSWYTDYSDYLKQYNGNIDQFVRWCDHWDISAQG